MKTDSGKHNNVKGLLRDLILTSMDNVSSLEVVYMVYYAVAPQQI